MKEPRNVLAAVRQALDCKQEDMAAYLELSRAHISNAETGTRFLPTEASLKLIYLYNLIPQTVEEEPPPGKPVSSIGIKNFRFKMERQLTRQRRHYEALETGREACLHALSYIAAIRQQAADTDAGLLLWLNLLQAKTRKRLDELAPERLALEKLKLTALEAAWQAVSNGEL